MVTLKKFDSYGQALIFCLGILLLFAKEDKWVLMSLFFNLPIGCWQIISAFIHFGLKRNLVTLKERNRYLLSVIVFFLILVASTEIETVIDNTTVTIWYFFFASTCLAIWYLYITIRELRIWEARQLIQLR